ncbi:hypothetical protein DFP73DRAFT_360589 [Morchella snyderi]|nr:hypothetical protein DFP73DRAFT_360589 [Morchella snyderi]
MPDLHSLPPNSRPEAAIRNNGPDDLALERYKIRELAEGWPCYRDACEWENFKSIFHYPDAYVYTTWTGRTPIADFIAASQSGMDRGAFIMHRAHGTTTDINAAATRAVTKMKATITQRFTLPGGCEVDAESDCRFFFLFEKRAGRWGACFVRHWYEKDKLLPVDPRRVPVLDDERLAAFPRGYRYLAYCQEVTMGVKVMRDMPGHRSEAAGSVAAEKHDLLYVQAKQWLQGEEMDI